MLINAVLIGKNIINTNKYVNLHSATQSNDELNKSDIFVKSNCLSFKGVDASIDMVKIANANPDLIIDNAVKNPKKFLLEICTALIDNSDVIKTEWQEGNPLPLNYRDYIDFGKLDETCWHNVQPELPSLDNTVKQLLKINLSDNVSICLIPMLEDREFVRPIESVEWNGEQLITTYGKPEREYFGGKYLGIMIKKDEKNIMHMIKIDDADSDIFRYTCFLPEQLSERDSLNRHFQYIIDLSACRVS